MEHGIATDWVTPERAEVMTTGARSGQQIVDAVFPPRPDDTDGSLAVSALEVLAKLRLQEMLKETIGDPQRRRWWLEGFVAGLCDISATTLKAAAYRLDMTALEHANHMRDHAARRLDPDAAAASSVVFALVEAILNDDEVACAWATENLFRPSFGRPGGQEVAARVKATCSSALMVCCASWQLLLFTPAD